MFGRAFIKFVIAFLAVLLALHGFFPGSPATSSGVSTGSDSGSGWFFFSGSDGGDSGSSSWDSGDNGGWDFGGGDSGSWDSGDSDSWDSGGGDSGSW